jgi:DNA-binding transcriptional MocR family regulator
MDLNDFNLSEYGRVSSLPSPASRMMADVAATFRVDKDINLGVGYVNEATIPRKLILEALQAIIANPDKYKLALNYGGPHGSSNLITSLKNYYINRQIGGLLEKNLDNNEIIIGANGATSLLEGIARVLKPGIVITSDPMYYIYCDYLERQGFEIITVSEDHHGIKTDLLEEKLKTLETRLETLSFFYIVTINNPTCSLLSNTRRREIIRIVNKVSEKLERKVPLIFDKAYEDLIHDPAAEQPLSGLLYDENKLVYEIGTISKILSPALRIGYMIGPDSPFMQAMIQKTSDVGFSAPLITQEIAGYLLEHHIDKQLDHVNKGYRLKAEKTGTWIKEHLEDYLEDISGGEAGFYFYLTFKDTLTTEGSPFFNFLSRATGNTDLDGPSDRQHPKVIYLPGQFCVHPKGDLVEKGSRQLRLSYGFEELEKIEQAILLMKQAVEYASNI